MAFLYLTIQTTLGEKLVVVGPFNKDEQRARWRQLFWTSLDALNEKLGLKNDPIGAEVLDSDHYLVLPNAEGNWQPSDAIRRIENEHLSLLRK